MKEKVAIIVHGGIGSGLESQGIPIRLQLIERLAEDYDITIFSLLEIDRSFVPKNYTLISNHLSYDTSIYLRIAKFLILFIRAQFLNKYKIIHGFGAFPCGFLAAFLAFIFRKKSLVSLQGGGVVHLPEINYGLYKSGIKKKILDWSWKNATRLTALTRYQKQFVIDAGIMREIDVIPYGVDTSLFGCKQKSNIKSDLIQIIHIGNINKVKGQDVLLRSFQLIAHEVNAKLVIIGPDYLNGSLFNIVTQLDIEDKVEFKGFQNYVQVAKELQNAHIMLHTSLFEGQAVVVNEAMASGVVVLGTNVGLISDLSPDACLAVPVGDFKGLANATLSILKDHDKMEQLRNNAFDWTAIHDINWTKNKFCEIYDELIKTR